MTLGDGIRRNIFSVSPEERQRFVNAIVQLNGRYFPPSKSDFPAGGVSYWFKMDEIHQATHVHGGPAFLPWHRQLCNYFESLLRKVDPDLSLYYWDWNQDISSLFPLFGNMTGEAGEPWLSAKFYDPAAPGDNWRDESVHSNPFNPTWTGNYPLHANPADPPKNRARNVHPGIPPVGSGDWPSDTQFRDCIERWCKERLSGPSEEELRQREGTSTVLDRVDGLAKVGPPSQTIALIIDLLRKMQ